MKTEHVRRGTALSRSADRASRSAPGHRAHVNFTSSGERISLTSTPARCANVTCRNSPPTLGYPYVRGLRRARHRDRPSACHLRENRGVLAISPGSFGAGTCLPRLQSKSSSSERPRDVPDQRRQRALFVHPDTVELGIFPLADRSRALPGLPPRIQPHAARTRVDRGLHCSRSRSSRPSPAISPKYCASPSCGVSSVSVRFATSMQIQVVVAAASHPREQGEAAVPRHACDALRCRGFRATRSMRPLATSTTNESRAAGSRRFESKSIFRPVGAPRVERVVVLTAVRQTPHPGAVRADDVNLRVQPAAGRNGDGDPVARWRRRPDGADDRVVAVRDRARPSARRCDEVPCGTPLMLEMTLNQRPSGAKLGDVTDPMRAIRVTRSVSSDDLSVCA